MYEGRIVNGFVSNEWVDKVDAFVEFSLKHPEFVNGGTDIKCPSPKPKYRNKQFLDVETMKLHLCRNGFMPDYYVWKYHGEKEVTGGRCFVTDEGGSSKVNQSIGNEFETLNHTSYHTIVLDATGSYLTA